MLAKLSKAFLVFKDRWLSQLREIQSVETLSLPGSKFCSLANMTIVKRAADKWRYKHAQSL
jgi:hypothetical protein